MKRDARDLRDSDLRDSRRDLSGTKPRIILIVATQVLSTTPHLYGLVFVDRRERLCASDTLNRTISDGLDLCSFQGILLTYSFFAAVCVMNIDAWDLYKSTICHETSSAARHFRRSEVQGRARGG